MYLKDIYKEQKKLINLNDLFPTKHDRITLFTDKFLKSKNKKILYIHIPYCPSKCKYCMCNSLVLKDKSDIGRLFEVYGNQINQYKEILENTLFSQVVFGGGTPTILNSMEMEQLFLMIPGFKNIPEKVMEGSPSTITNEHLQLLKKWDFDYISLGIQSTFRSICEKENRPFLSHQEIISLSKCLRESGIKFNYDLICYLNNGDIQDLRYTYYDADFIMNSCKPNYITIHQKYQSSATYEKTKYLMQMIKELIYKNGSYVCVNSRLLEADILMDTIYRAEYRLMSRDTKGNFRTYMWNRYTQIPVYGYDILSIGYLKNASTMSNAGTLELIDDKLVNYKFDPAIKQLDTDAIIEELIDKKMIK